MARSEAETYTSLSDKLQVTGNDYHSAKTSLLKLTDINQEDLSNLSKTTFNLKDFEQKKNTDNTGFITYHGILIAKTDTARNILENGRVILKENKSTWLTNIEPKLVNIQKKLEKFFNTNKFDEKIAIPKFEGAEEDYLLQPDYSNDNRFMLHYIKNNKNFTISFKFVGEKIQSFSKDKNFPSTFNTIEDILKLLELALPQKTPSAEQAKKENNSQELSSELPKDQPVETTAEEQQRSNKPASKRFSCRIQ